MKRLWLVLGCAALAGAAWATDAPAGKEGAAEPAAAAADGVTITKGVLCSAVSDREPVDGKESGAEYEAAVERLYFWTSAQVGAPPQTIKHVWYRDGKAVTEVSLELKHPRTRTWSNKRVSPGAWKVEAIAADGTVLQTVEFAVK